ncbi:hypothetical protein [Parabacteroides goldsteinii]|uniref:hypothetical protein n=1 Tax=Parabacteroides goldsteinii TaxID=328812 RepID=UPI00242D66FB|nr:hypothetical protein [Parabacteroides goldsteinii]
MRTATSDALKVDIFRKITMLDNEEQLRQVYDYLSSLLLERQEVKEYVMPIDLLESAIEYTNKVIEKGGPFYTTSEVFDSIDRELGWK